MNSEIEFFTATCLNWNALLRFDQRKDIIIESLRFLVNDNRIWVYGFVIMPNHIHIVWSKQEQWQAKNIEQIFLKYTAQQLKFNLIDSSRFQEPSALVRVLTNQPVKTKLFTLIPLQG